MRTFCPGDLRHPGFQQKIINKKAGNFPPLSKLILVQRYGYFFEEDSGSEKIRVFIVDDNRELVRLLEDYISQQEDMEICGTAYSGTECLERLKEADPDILLLDIIMPHLDGLGVLEKLKESAYSRMPNVIMLTAFGQEDVTKKRWNWAHPILC